MAGSIYRLTDLTATAGEDGEAPTPELLTDVDLVARFAPGIDTTKASQAGLVNNWIKGFTTNEAIQAGFGVKVEKVDARQVFDQRIERFQELERLVREEKKEVIGSLRAVLSDITPEDIAKGDVHTVSATGKNKVGVVEYYVSKSKIPVKDFAGKYGHDFSDEVKKELDKVQKKRSDEAAKRIGGKA